VALFGTNHAATTLTGSCGSSPGVACRVVWDLTHNGQLASLTINFFVGPAHLLLRVAYVLALAFIIRAVLQRLIKRITERAADSILPQLRGGVATSLLASRLQRRRRGKLAADAAAGATDAADDIGAAAPGGATVTGPAAEAMGIRADATAGEIAATAASVERALVAERRHQRIRALGSILHSAASVTVFSIAGVVVLGDLGINLAALLASAGVVGVAIGFGAQSLVRDYLAGILMLVEDQYGVGDVITVGHATGTVENVTLRITRIRDVNGIVWHIRNGGVEAVGNESQGWARAVIDFPVPYEADLATTRGLLAEVGDAMWNDPTWRSVMLEAPEVWGAQQISGAEVIMRIVVKTAPLRQWEVEREMRARVKTTLHEAGIPPVPAVD
jgi:small conductance mechanosensitive channel